MNKNIHVTLRTLNYHYCVLSVCEFYLNMDRFKFMHRITRWNIFYQKESYDKNLLLPDSHKIEIVKFFVYTDNPRRIGEHKSFAKDG